MSDAVNPYESPQIASIANSQASAPVLAESPDAKIAALEERVAQLERLLAQSWFVSPQRYRRIMAVWGYFILGYIGVLIVAIPFVLVEWLLFRRS